jgi:2-dehydropantoate 2-reductase
MRVLVYGGGAVGLGLASCLIQAGAAVQIVARPATAARLSAEGLERTGIFGDCTAPPGAFAAYAGLDEIPPGVPFDFILVCVKSFDTVRAAADLARRPDLVALPACLVLCQNGWGNHEKFLEVLSGPPLYSARVITGFRRPRENAVEITVHAEAVHIGTLDTEPLGAVEPLCAALTRGGLPCETTPAIARDLWAKMLYNCALNPLGAVFGVRYGALAASPHSRAIMDTILDEIYAVMGAAGHQTHWPDAAAYRQVFYEKLIPSTAAHFSSTLQDLRAGKRTEIDALSGAVVALGRRHGIAAPVNATLHAMVKFQEGRQGLG